MSVEVRSAAAGAVFEVLVNVGDEVGSDQILLVLEAMKMEIPVASPADGRVTEIRVAEGDSVEEGHVVLTLD